MNRHGLRAHPQKKKTELLILPLNPVTTTSLESMLIQRA